MKKLCLYLTGAMLVPLLFSCGARKKMTNPSAAFIQKKYSRILGVDEAVVANTRLYSFIDNWYGVPYQYAGKSRSGVDCSGFTCILYKDAFNRTVSGSSASLHDQCKKLTKEELSEGDLVFFCIPGKDKPGGAISHVGVYLQNNKFVHATTKGGVIIDDLNNEYYLKYFADAGRLE